MEPLTFINDIEPITSQPIAALAAQVGEDRNQFLSFLTQNGVERLSDRQFFTNALTKMVRTGRITRGWAKPEPLVTKCSSCQSVPNKGKKLLVCGRCKSAHYCDAKCQKAHWMAGHKATCARPELTAAEQWAKVDDTGVKVPLRRYRISDRMRSHAQASRLVTSTRPFALQHIHAPTSSPLLIDHRRRDRGISQSAV